MDNATIDRIIRKVAESEGCTLDAEGDPVRPMPLKTRWIEEISLHWAFQVFVVGKWRLQFLVVSAKRPVLSKARQAQILRSIWYNTGKPCGSPEEAYKLVL